MPISYTLCVLRCPYVPEHANHETLSGRAQRCHKRIQAAERPLTLYFHRQHVAACAYMWAAMRVKETAAAVLAGFFARGVRVGDNLRPHHSRLPGCPAAAPTGAATSVRPLKLPRWVSTANIRCRQRRGPRTEPPAAAGHLPLAGTFRAAHSIGCAGDPCGKKLAWAGPETVRAARGSERFPGARFLRSRRQHSTPPRWPSRSAPRISSRPPKPRPVAAPDHPANLAPSANAWRSVLRGSAPIARPDTVVA